MKRIQRGPVRGISLKLQVRVAAAAPVCLLACRRRRRCNDAYACRRLRRRQQRGIGGAPSRGERCSEMAARETPAGGAAQQQLAERRNSRVTCSAPG